MKPPRPAAGNRRHPPALRSRRQVRFPPRQVLLLLRGVLPPGRRAAVQRPPASRETAGTANSGTEKPASSSGKQEAGYEAEVKALLRQLYSVKARAEAELNSCIAGAKAEFKSLPESQQTQARKISIVLARSGRLYAMQASYDKEVESIVSQMRAILTANGQSTALADQAMASYKAQKSAMYSPADRKTVLLTRKTTTDHPQHISRAPTVLEKGLRMVLFCLFAVIWRKMPRTWRDDSTAETLPFTPTGEGGLYAPTEQFPKRPEK